MDHQENTPLAIARRVARERADGQLLQIRDRLPHAELLQVLGVSYMRFATGSTGSTASSDEPGEIYLTNDGAQLLPQLQPEHWHERAWFREKRVQLEGTSAVYRIQTHPRAGTPIDLVVKYNRVGQEVAADHDLLEEALAWEFNGPFEEFSLVEQMRHDTQAQQFAFATQVPLAIYIPPERTQAWRTGRTEWRMVQKGSKHPGLVLDILRHYVMVYRWLPGIDLSQAYRQGLISKDNIKLMMERVSSDVALAGFCVHDHKPQHVIIDAQSDCSEQAIPHLSYGLIDYELLERLPEKLQKRQARVHDVYDRQRDSVINASQWTDQKQHDVDTRADERPATCEVWGVPYVFGRAESTGGWLWVVGSELEAFELFLPERWRTTAQIRMWGRHESYLTTSKDNLKLVWRVSRVGQRPHTAASGREGFRVLTHGVNSPFEEVAFAITLARHGVGATFPRAIYCTGHRSSLNEALFDHSRYRSHARYRLVNESGLRSVGQWREQPERNESVDEQPLLDPRRSYITLWDCCTGNLASRIIERPVVRSLNCVEACKLGLLSDATVSRLLARLAERIEDAGLTALRLRPSHVLVLQDVDGSVVSENGRIQTRLCNFLYLRRGRS
jgi:hypothetical protein